MTRPQSVQHHAIHVYSHYKMLETQLVHAEFDGDYKLASKLRPLVKRYKELHDNGVEYEPLH